MILLYLLTALLVLVLAVSFLCFHITFYVPHKKVYGPKDFPVPDGPEYVPFHGQMIAWMQEVRKLTCRELAAVSHDGLQLYGKYYHFADGAPIEIMFHGYRGSGERDLCGGVQRAFALGHSALIVDQRGAGRSDGRVISFGVNESRDCLRWTQTVIDTFGPGVKIILTGISMGASTVLLAAGQDLPKNVIGVLADCGYTSAEEIIKTVIAKMHLPPSLAYPFVRLGARIFGGFDPNEANATKALANCKVPVIFAHGAADDFVPCAMSEANFRACPTHKRLLTVPNAGHGLSYIVAPQAYLEAAGAFFREIEA